MFKKVLVVEQEKSSIHLQSSKPQPTLLSSKHTVCPRNSSSQGALEASGWGCRTPPRIARVFTGHCCWGCKSFCFQWASSFQVVLGWIHLQDEATCRNPQMSSCTRPQREQGWSQGSGAAARAVLGGFSLPGSPYAGALSVLLWRGDLRGRLSPAEKLVPQTLISQVKLCCGVPPFPACRKTAALAWSDKDEKANVAQSLPCRSGD